ncbi:hypothetical protein [Phreatobacter stygius]|uniref:Uncharacterized protein n=1 Tax=Phreatobacter stygius TaxID=1940610 RepID=A0A4D7BHF5_9HYPH|nr:hypothetical protein [Phreatobacter stygius]QCI67237.1 hypothetical protein E8M01_25185 [Phreatobacter stygius]
MSDVIQSRRAMIFGALASLVGLTALSPEAEAQGRGWGPDGMGPPGQRRRSGWIPPGHRRHRRGRGYGWGRRRGHGW